MRRFTPRAFLPLGHPFGTRSARASDPGTVAHDLSESCAPLFIGTARPAPWSVLLLLTLIAALTKSICFQRSRRISSCRMPVFSASDTTGRCERERLAPQAASGVYPLEEYRPQRGATAI